VSGFSDWKGMYNWDKGFQSMSANAITPDDLLLHRTERLCDARILARRYTRPAYAGLIVVPESWRQDHSLTIWEVVSWHPDAEVWLGEPLATTDILVTKPFKGTFVGRLGTKEDHFILKADDIEGRIPEAPDDAEGVGVA
jgi:hypothetical protein